MGIEPTSKAWEALILPLNYARSVLTLSHAAAVTDNSQLEPVGANFWC